MSGVPKSSREAALLGAVEQAVAGDWQAAHMVAQRHEGDSMADWLHAVVHRMEGDLGNARYWYRRCGRELREGVSTEAELQEIAAALAGVTTGSRGMP